MSASSFHHLTKAGFGLGLRVILPWLFVPALSVRNSGKPQKSGGRNIAHERVWVQRCEGATRFNASDVVKTYIDLLAGEHERNSVHRNVNGLPAENELLKSVNAVAAYFLRRLLKGNYTAINDVSSSSVSLSRAQEGMSSCEPGMVVSVNSSIVLLWSGIWDGNCCRARMFTI